MKVYYSLYLLHGRTPVRQVEDDKSHGDADTASHQRHNVGRPHHRLGDTRVLVFLAALLRVRLHGHRVRRRQDPVLVGERPCWVRLNLCQGISWLVWLFIRQSSSLLSARFVFNFFLFLYLFHSSHFWVETSKEMLRSFSV